MGTLAKASELRAQILTVTQNIVVSGQVHAH